MRGYIYGEIKDKLLEIRAKHTDKIIKCYIITKSMNVYPITKISKRNIYYINDMGEEVSVKEPISEVYEDIMSVCTAISKLKFMYETKIQNLYKVLHKIDEVDSYLQDTAKGELKWKYMS